MKYSGFEQWSDITLFKLWLRPNSLGQLIILFLRAFKILLLVNN